MAADVPSFYMLDVSLPIVILEHVMALCCFVGATISVLSDVRLSFLILIVVRILLSHSTCIFPSPMTIPSRLAVRQCIHVAGVALWRY
jgi:hypothetical protein